MTSMFVKLETPLSEYSLVCRGCLAESGEMKNIREWGLTEDFCKITDILLQSKDGISELLCTACEDALMMCARFKRQCQQTHVVLRNIAQKKTEEAKLQEQDSTQTDSTKNTVTFTFNDNLLAFTIHAPNMEEKVNLPCPYNCKERYIKQNDLLKHLNKNHNVHNCSIDLKYFCDHPKCIYNKMENFKWFTKRKSLNQHYNSVHKNRQIQCKECNSKFALQTEFDRHVKICNVAFRCEICDILYKTDARLLVHLMRHHPELHKQYKNAKKAEKRKSSDKTDSKRLKTETDKYDFICDSPKRSFATQTLENTIRNDVSLSWTPSNFAKTDEISTQTVFEDLLSLKSQSEDDSLFFSETVSLSDIQTQTFPIELNRSNKETLTDPDMSMKETQTCFCRYDTPKRQFRLFNCEASTSGNLTSTETQTSEFRSNVTDVLLSFSSAETQTCFDGD